MVDAHDGTVPPISGLFGAARRPSPQVRGHLPVIVDGSSTVRWTLSRLAARAALPPVHYQEGPDPQKQARRARRDAAAHAPAAGHAGISAAERPASRLTLNPLPRPRRTGIPPCRTGAKPRSQDRTPHLAPRQPRASHQISQGVTGTAATQPARQLLDVTGKPVAFRKGPQGRFTTERQCGRAGGRLLKEILVWLGRDEARHFSFFADMIRLYLERYGDSLVESIREVIAGFRMPLADTIKGYWRWARKIADTA